VKNQALHVLWIVSNVGPIDDVVEIACGYGRPAELTASRGVIRSPGYDRSRYPNNARCQWHIQAPPDRVGPIR